MPMISANPFLEEGTVSASIQFHLDIQLEIVRIGFLEQVRNRLQRL